MAIDKAHNRHARKWAALVFSFFNVSGALILIALPVTFILSVFIASIFNMSSNSVFSITSLIMLTPLFLVVLKFYKISGQSAKDIVETELVSDGSASVIDTSIVNDDAITEKIRNAFNEARTKLDMNDQPVVLMRSTQDEYNAFAISSRVDNVIVVFDGLSTNVSDEKLQAVIGHEFGHIKNKDSLQKMLLFALQYYIPHAAVWSDKIITITHSFLTGMRNKWINLFSIIIILCFRMMLLSVRFSLWINNFINAYAFKQGEHLADQIGVQASSREAMIGVLTDIELLENQSEEKPTALYLLLAEHPKTSVRINYIQSLK